ncbi:MAG: hypothetical protein II781_04020 [Clostridia bacterium]|nr:hypothetical protein [Clostridia bacterium]
MKKIVILLLAVSMLLCVSCRNASPAPGSTVPGYYGAGQTLTGGSDSSGAAALVQGDVVRNGEELCFSFGFADADGNRVTVPSYSLSLTEDPIRLCLTVPSMQFPFGTSFAPIKPCLGCVQEDGEKGTSTLYFQFMGQQCFKASVKENILTVSVRPCDGTEQEAAYIAVSAKTSDCRLAGAEPSAETGTVSWGEKGFHPVLCADGEHILLLSSPYTQMEELDRVLLSLKEELEQGGDDRIPQVFHLIRGEVPVYQELISRAAIDELGAMDTGSETVKPEMWATDARFLNWNGDRTSALMARQILVENLAGGSTQKYEQLYLYPENDVPQILADVEMGLIAKAEFSPDGSMVAFIEVSDGFRLLYLYDIRSETLLYLPGEGLGEYTADFVWNTDGRLYCMCGAEKMQLMLFDPYLTEDDEDRIRVVEEREGFSGNIFLNGGKLYLNGDDDMIYILDPATGDRGLYADGAILSITEDGRYMAILRPCATGCGRELVIRDTQSEESAVISDDVPVMGVCWMRDQRTLCCLVTNEGSDREIYPSILRKAEAGKNGFVQIGRLASNSVFAGKEDDMIVLVSSYQARADAYAPVTFRLQLPKIM